MSEIDSGGPAFPVSPKKVEAGLVYMACDGLSKREWFDGMALQGLLDNLTIRFLRHGRYL